MQVAVHGKYPLKWGPTVSILELILCAVLPLEWNEPSLLV